MPTSRFECRCSGSTGPNQEFRGFAGQIASGRMGPGSEVRILPSGRTTKIARVVTFDGDLDEAVAGQSVTVTLADEVDCSRGDVISAAADPPEAADQFEATIVWMSEEELLPGRGYWLKLGAQTVTATIHEPKYEVNVNTLDHLAAKTLGPNSIGVAEVSTEPRDRVRGLCGAGHEPQPRRSAASS